MPNSFLNSVHILKLIISQIHHQVTVSRSHIREVFESKCNHIFADTIFPSRTSKDENIGKKRQDAIQPLREKNKFIYSREDGKYTKPFTSNYIQNALEFLIFSKKPRFKKLLTAGEYINHHVIAVVCTFVRIVLPFSCTYFI